MWSVGSGLGELVWVWPGQEMGGSWFGSLVFQKGRGQPASTGKQGKIAGAKTRVVAERSLSGIFFSKEGEAADLYQRNRFQVQVFPFFSILFSPLFCMLYTYIYR